MQTPGSSIVAARVHRRGSAAAAPRGLRAALARADGQRDGERRPGVWAAVTAMVVLLAGCSFDGPVHSSSMAPPPSTSAPRSVAAETGVSARVDARQYVAEPCLALPSEYQRDLLASSGTPYNHGDISTCEWTVKDNAKLTLTLSQNSNAPIKTLAAEDPISSAKFEETSVDGYRALLLEPPSPSTPHCVVHIQFNPALALSIRIERLSAVGSCFLVTEVATEVVSFLRLHG
ncbi:DUF3558 domain-containing protein [Saccharothrix sp. AJ9571]|nr:DUF3558 domain-containing protein [Saccharothrix sp. AJ9571]